MTKSIFLIDKPLVYSLLRPYQTILIEILGSYRTTSVLSFVLGTFQLLFFGQLMLIILYWHFSRLQVMANSCGSLSLTDIHPSTILCFLRISLPGNLLIIPFAGFCVWPLCLIASKYFVIFNE